MSKRSGVRGRVRALVSLVTVLSLPLLSACPAPPPPPPPAAELTQHVVWKEAGGHADDAEAPPPRREYTTDGARATDNQSFAGSHAVTWNTIGGYAHAVPGDAPNENEDAAVAVSQTKVQSELLVRRAGNVTFQTALLLDGLDIEGDASVEVRMMLVVQDARGRPLRDANGNLLPNSTYQKAYRASNDTSGNLQVTAPGGGSAGGTLTGDRFEDSPSTPAPGVTLGAGRYWVQMELNVIAQASASFPDPSQKPEAHLDTARLTLSVR